MKQFIDFIPLIVFFVLYKLEDIYWATGGLIVATALQVAFNLVKYRKVEKTLLITFLMVLGFGTLTLTLQDDAFIKWKVTVVYGLFTIVLLASQYIWRKPLIKQMLGKELQLPDVIWDRVNLSWAAFFAGCGALNVYVAFSLPQETWVNFKVFGLMGLTLLFTIGTIFAIYKHIPQQSQEENS
jgi:intracellular septation protein